MLTLSQVVEVPPLMTKARWKAGNDGGRTGHPPTSQETLPGGEILMLERLSGWAVCSDQWPYVQLKAGSKNRKESLSDGAHGPKQLPSPCPVATVHAWLAVASQQVLSIWQGHGATGHRKSSRSRPQAQVAAQVRRRGWGGRGQRDRRTGWSRWGRLHTMGVGSGMHSRVVWGVSMVSLFISSSWPSILQMKTLKLGAVTAHSQLG